MSTKGSKRIRDKTLINYTKTAGLMGVPLGILLFAFLFSSGIVELKGNYTSNELCGGDITCYLEMNELCFNKDTFVYPMNGAELVNARPTDSINDLKLYRSWGNSWREIKLNDTCKGTWCGGKKGATNNAYSFAFRKDKCYDIRIEVDKDENSTINWKINPEGTWFGKGDIVVLDTNTPNCIDCYTDYELTNPTSSEICSKPNVSFVNEENLNSYELQSIFNKTINKTIQTPIIYNTTGYICSEYNSSCSGDIVNSTYCCSNQTVQLVNYTYSTETSIVYDWQNIEGEYICIQPNESTVLRVSGSIKPNSGVDNIICYADYCFPEYAWWNSSYEFKRNITNLPSSNIAFSINQTNKFFDYNIWTNPQVCNGTLDVYYNNITDINVVCNDTIVNPFEIEQLGTGSLTTSVYSSNAKAVYHFGNHSSGVNDSTSNKNDLILYNGATLSSGVYDIGMYFDGTNDYADTGYTGISGTNDFTLAFWVNPYSLVADEPVASSLFYSGGWTGFAILEQLATTEIKIQANGYSCDVLTENTWQHFVVTRSGNNIKCYINGVNTNIITSSNSVTSRSLYLAQNNDATFPRNSNIGLDEFRIYNKALTLNEVQELYNNSIDNNNMILGIEQTEVAPVITDITLNAPADASVFYKANNPIKFNFTVSSNKTTYNCSIYFNGTLNSTNTSVLNGTLTNFGPFDINKGDWTWNINCDGTDSNIWTFSMNNTAPQNTTIITPINGSTLYSNSVIIEYTSVDIDGDSLTFDLYINGTFNSTNTTNTTLDFPFGSYSIQVFANDGTATNGSNIIIFDIQFINLTTSLCANMSTIDFSPNISFYNITTGTLTQYNISPDNQSFCGFTYNFSTGLNKAFNVSARLNTTLPETFDLRYNGIDVNSTSWIIIIENMINFSLINLTGSYINASSFLDWTDEFMVSG